MHAIAAYPQPAGLGNPVSVVGIPLAQEDNLQERKWQGCFVPFFRKVTKLNVINKPFLYFFSVTTDKIVNLYRLGVPFPQDSQQIFSCSSIPPLASSLPQGPCRQPQASWSKERAKAFRPIYARRNRFPPAYRTAATRTAGASSPASVGCASSGCLCLSTSMPE